MSCKHAKVNAGYSDLVKVMNMLVTAHSVAMAETAELCTGEDGCRRSLEVVDVLSMHVAKVFSCSLYLHLCESVIVVANTNGSDSML